MGKLAAQLSARDLETLLKLKQDGGRVAGLRKKRDKIARDIAAIDRQIAAIDGGSAPAKRGRKPGAPVAKKRGRPAAKKRSRPAAAKTAAKAPARKSGRQPKGRAGNLPAMLEAVMKKHGRPISLGDAAKALTAAGYKSKGSAAVLRKMVSMACRRRDDLFARASKGMYKLA